MSENETSGPSERITVDQTPDPGDIERAPTTERASKMPSIPGTTMDPKKMIGFAAADRIRHDEGWERRFVDQMRIQLKKRGKRLPKRLL